MWDFFACGKRWKSTNPTKRPRSAQQIDPERIPLLVNRSIYWMHSGRALAQLRGRHEDAVRALRTAENIFPTMVLRDPNVREALATLLPSTRRDAIGMELRGLAYRAGLLV
jgi:hypothetical protein